MRWIRAFTENLYINLLVGLVLVFTSGMEIVRDFHSAGGPHIGAHHGVALYGLLMVLKSIPELVEGLSHIGRVEEASGEQRG